MATDTQEETTLRLERYAADAKGLVVAAQALADERKHVEVEPIHLLARAIDRDAGVAEVMRRSGAAPADMLALADAALKKLPQNRAGVAYLSAALLDLLARAEREADRDRAPEVGVEHVLNALSQELRGAAGEVLAAFALGPGAFRPHLGALRAADRPARSANAQAASPGAADPRARYARDLVAIAREGGLDPVVGRNAEVRRLLQILERRYKSHPLVVGEPGVGKTALVSALAQRIAAGDVPSNLVGARLWELDTGALASGAKLRGELEERLKQLVAAFDVNGANGESILVVEGFDALFGQGSAGSAVGDVLRPLLAKGDLRILATTTPDGVRKIQDRDAGVLRKLTHVPLDPPSVDQSVEILRAIATRYERHHQVSINEGAIVAAVTLARRYAQDRALPDSAVDLLDETAARKRVEIDGVPAETDEATRRLESVKAQAATLADDDDRASNLVKKRLADELATLTPKVADLRAKLDLRRKAMAQVVLLRGKLREAAEGTAQALRAELEAAVLSARKDGVADTFATVSDADVAETLAEWTGIPVAKMLEGEADKLLKMEARLGKRIVGQDEPVRAIARAVRRGRVGLRDPGKPIGSFLFLGPSGVGKTELAKALAEFLFDDEGALTRLDMSEFMERHMAQRLVGAPPGYVDSEQGGFLTEAVRRRPYSVLLFDEVEKAHADVFNLLLQLLDDGRLTDGRGRTADFSNTVVIMTSNIGSQRILETEHRMFESEEGREAVRDVLMLELRSFFRPEFLNRVDDTIVFRPLDKKDLRGIVDIQLRRLDKLLESRELKLVLSDGAKDRLVDMGYEPAFGARPLKRAILKQLQNPLAEEILAGGYQPGDTVHVEFAADAFAFRRAP